MKKNRAVVEHKNVFRNVISVILAAVMLCMLCACGKTDMGQDMTSQADRASEGAQNTGNIENVRNTGAADTENGTEAAKTLENMAENFVLIPGGTFHMGSPETESWRSEDETQHTVIVSDFYMSIYELTQAEYQEIMGENPSSFSGDDLPVENITWLDAIRYCNARSEKEGFVPAYTIDGQTISWNRGADGYRLPTEAEWEYACRAVPSDNRCRGQFFTQCMGTLQYAWKCGRMGLGLLWGLWYGCRNRPSWS